MIVNVSYILDSNGTYTKMILKRKDAYMANPIKPKATKNFGFDILDKQKVSISELLKDL